MVKNLDNRFFKSLLLILFISLVSIVFLCNANKKNKNSSEVVSEPIFYFGESSNANTGDFENKFLTEEEAPVKKSFNEFVTMADTQKEDLIGVQRSLTMNQNGTISIRFIFETASEDETFTIYRRVYEEFNKLSSFDDSTDARADLTSSTYIDKDEVSDLELNDTLTFTCQYRYTAVSEIIDGETVVTYPSEGYKYFFVYVLEDIPADKWFSYIRIQTKSTDASSTSTKIANVCGILRSEKINYYNRFSFLSGVVKANQKDKTDYFIPEYQPISVDGDFYKYVCTKGTKTKRVEGFASLSKATLISVPKTVDAIGSNCFKSCNNLVALLLGDGNQNFVDLDGNSVSSTNAILNATNFKEGNSILINNQSNTEFSDMDLSHSYWTSNDYSKNLQYYATYSVSNVTMNRSIALRKGDKISLKKSGVFNYQVLFMSEESYKYGDTLLFNDKFDSNSLFTESADGLSYEYTFNGVTPGYSSSDTQALAHRNALYFAVNFTYKTGKNYQTEGGLVSDARKLITITRNNCSYYEVNLLLDSLTTTDKAFYSENFTTTLNQVSASGLVVKVGGTEIEAGSASNQYTLNQDGSFSTLTIKKVLQDISLSLNDNMYCSVSYNGVDRKENVMYALKGQELLVEDLWTQPSDLFIVEFVDGNPYTLDNSKYSYQFSNNSGTLTVFNVENNIAICSKKDTSITGRNWAFDGNGINTLNDKRASSKEEIQVYSNEKISFTMTQGIRIGFFIVYKDSSNVTKSAYDSHWITPSATGTLGTYFTAINKQDVSIAVGQTIELTYEELRTLAPKVPSGSDIYVVFNYCYTPEASVVSGVTDSYVNVHTAKFNEIVKIIPGDVPVTHTITVVNRDSSSYTVACYEGSTLTLEDLGFESYEFEVVDSLGNIISTGYTYNNGIFVYQGVDQDFKVQYKAPVYNTITIIYEDETRKELSVRQTSDLVINDLPFAKGDFQVKYLDGQNEVIVPESSYTYVNNTLTYYNVMHDLIICYRDASKLDVTFININEISHDIVVDGSTSYSVNIGAYKVEEQIDVTMGSTKLTSSQISYNYETGELTLHDITITQELTIKYNYYRVYYSDIDANTNVLSHNGVSYVATGLTLETKDEISIYKRAFGANQSYKVLSSEYTYSNGTLTISNDTINGWTLDGWELIINHEITFMYKASYNYWNSDNSTIVEGGRSNAIRSIEPRIVYENEKLDVQVPSGLAGQIVVATRTYNQTSKKYDYTTKLTPKQTVWIRNQTNEKRYTVGIWLEQLTAGTGFTSPTNAQKAAAEARFGSFYTNKKDLLVGNNTNGTYVGLSFTYEELCLIGGYDPADKPEIYVMINLSCSNSWTTSKYANANPYFSVTPLDYQQEILQG